MELNTSYLEKYLQYTCSENFKQIIDKNTSSDLNFDELFQKTDFTASALGKQYLFYRLKTYTEKQNQQKKDIDFLSSNGQLVSSLEKALSLLNNYESFFIADLLWEKTNQQLWYNKLGLFMSALSVLSIPFLFVYPALLSFFIILILLNTFIYMLAKKSNLLHFWKFKGLKQFILASQNIEEDTRLTSLNFYPGKRNISGKLKFWLTFVDTEESHDSVFLNEMSSLGKSLLEYLKIIFLAEFLAQHFIFLSIRKNRRHLQETFQFLAYHDFLISIIKFRQSLPYYCEPDWADTTFAISTTELFHPLVEGFVPQQIEIKKQAIITGPNMSGKTTFLRTIGVNVILAQSLHTVCARSYRANWFNIISAIQLEDNILEGQSLYLAEVKRLKQVLDGCNQTETKTFVLIDEIFKGTNSTERLAAALAYLEYLAENKNTVSVTSTHQLEIADRLSDNFTLLEVSRGNFQINSGRTKKRNGIQLLEENNYPSAIVNRAKAIIEHEN